MMWNGFEGMGWGWLGLGMVHMLLFWVLVILGIVVLVRTVNSGPDRGSDAMDILKSRYAKGELTLEQFEQMKRAIADKA